MVAAFFDTSQTPLHKLSYKHFAYPNKPWEVSICQSNV